MSFLILTDSATHGQKMSLYPIAAQLSDLIGEDPVYVADRADTDNHDFFYRHTNPSRTLQVRRIHSDYSYDSFSTYPVQTLSCDDVKTLWLRIDHPVTVPFLEFIRQEFSSIPVLNSPEGLLETASKEFLISLQDVMGDLMPPVTLCHTPEDIETFRRRVPHVVLKGTRSKGGASVFRYRTFFETDITQDTDLSSLLAEHGPFLAMAYVEPPGEQVDNRLVIMDGEFLGAVSRRAGEGNWRCNLDAGGSGGVTNIDAREQEIIAHIVPLMNEKGIFLYGIDTLLNGQNERVLSEINTLNVGCIHKLEEGLGAREVTGRVAGTLARYHKSSRPLAVAQDSA